MSIYRWALQTMCSLLPVSCLSAPDTLFINALGAAVPRDQALYYRIRLPDSSQCLVRDYDLRHILRREETYSNCDAVIRQGPAWYFDEAGRLMEHGNFVKGRKAGEWRLYYSGGTKLRMKEFYEANDTCRQILYDSLSGRVTSQGCLDASGRRCGTWLQYHFRSYSVEWVLQYRYGQKDGEQRQFFMSGQMQRRELYRQGRLQKGYCWNSHGKKVHYHPSFTYPQPSTRLRKLLYAECPCFEKELPLGDLELHCLVRSDGRLEDVRIVGGRSADCRKEMEETVRRMKKWKPATAEQKPVDCPFVFRIRYYAPKD